MQTKNIKINDINTDDFYEGYLWISDRKKPEVFYGNNKIQIDQFTKNTFIVEGFLYKEGTSYSIKFVDGEYLIKQYTDVIIDENKVKEYIPNRMGNKKLRFMQEWTAVPDDNCAGFDVLQPSDVVFIGFKNKED